MENLPEIADALRLGPRRHRILLYLLDHPELDDPDNTGDTIFHRGSGSRVVAEDIAKRTQVLKLGDDPT